MFAVFILGMAAGPESWPAFRGPTGDGHAPAGANPPITWSETENVRWKAAVPGKGWSSPVVLDGRIWMTSATEDGKQLSAVALDRNTGSIIHNVVVFHESNPAFCHPFNSYASCTPALETDRAYVHFGTYGTACLDAKTGKTLWERRDLNCNHHRGPASSPILYNDLLILTFDGYDVQYLAALDKNTGKTVWKRERNIKYSTADGDMKKAYSTPGLFEIAGKPMLVSPSAEATTAHDPKTGDEFWRIHHGGMNGSARPLFAHGLLYLTSGHNQNLLAVKPEGTGTLGKDHIAWKQVREVPTRPSLILSGELLLMCDDKGVASCCDAKSGKQYWKERLSGEFSASPVLAGGRVYFCGQDGRTHVLLADKQYKVESVNKLDGTFMASPAVVGNDIIVRTKTHVYCIGK
jgi:outer membrane protein assembly factor BamB